MSPAVLIFSDTDEGLDRAVQGAARAGGRIVAALHIDDAIARLEDQVAVDLVIVDVVEDHGAAGDHLLGLLAQAVGAGRFAAIVMVAPHCLDAVSAAIRHQDMAILVGHDGEMLVEAAARAMKRPVLQLHDNDGSDDAARLAMLNEEMDRIARTLSASIEEADGRAGADSAPISFEELRPADAGVLRDLIRGRRLREHFFGRGLFADPAWDILLDLTAARIERRPVAVSSLCIAAAVPATTALRWIKQLTDAGLLQRVDDPGDGRRVFIELTDKAASRMMAYFSAMARGGRG